MTLSPRACRCVAIAVVVSILVSRADAQTDRVILYNGGTNDDFDNAAHGFAWQEAGFLDASGRPLGTNADGDIVNDGGGVVGRRVRRGDRTIGYTNAAGTVTVVDLSRGTFTEAFEEVTNAGTIQIIKHGGWIDSDLSGTITAGDVLGGSLQLDGGRYFSGFGAGTNDGTGAPYPVPRRAGGGINVDLRCCWGALDPDGAPGGSSSVTDSLRGLPGIATVTGATDVVRLGPLANWSATLPSGVRREDVEAVLNANLPAGFTSYGDWVASLGFADQLRLLRARFGTVTVGGRTITLTWGITYRFGVGAGGALETTPQILRSLEGGLMRHIPFSGSGLEALFVLDPLVDMDAFPLTEALSIDRLPFLPGGTPSGLELFSGVYSLHTVDDGLDRVSGTAFLDLLPGAPLDARLFWFLDGGWSLLGENGSAFEWARFSGDHFPTFAVFGGRGVPEPAVFPLVALGLAGCALARRARGLRSRMTELAVRVWVCVAWTMLALPTAASADLIKLTIGSGPDDTARFTGSLFGGKEGMGTTLSITAGSTAADAAAALAAATGGTAMGNMVTYDGARSGSIGFDAGLFDGHGFRRMLMAGVPGPKPPPPTIFDVPPPPPGLFLNITKRGRVRTVDARGRAKKGLKLASLELSVETTFVATDTVDSINDRLFAALLPFEPLLPFGMAFVQVDHFPGLRADVDFDFEVLDTFVLDAPTHVPGLIVGASVSSIDTVPEPAAVLLIAVGAAVWTRRWRPRRWR